MNTATLFAEPSTTLAAVTLWWRESRRHKWRLIATDDDSGKALQFDRPGGHWYVSFDRRNPNADG